MLKALAGILLSLFLSVAPVYGGVTEVATLNLLTGADTDITTTNFAPQVALATTLHGGYIVKVCITWTNGVQAPQDGTLYLFDADPTIAANDATLTVAEAQTVVLELSFTTEDFQIQFATASVACKDLDSAFHTISHAAWHNSDANTVSTSAIDLHMWVK